MPGAGSISSGAPDVVLRPSGHATQSPRSHADVVFGGAASIPSGPWRGFPVPCPGAGSIPPEPPTWFRGASDTPFNPLGVIPTWFLAAPPQSPRGPGVVFRHLAQVPVQSPQSPRRGFAALPYPQKSKEEREEERKRKNEIEVKRQNRSTHTPAHRDTSKNPNYLKQVPNSLNRCRLPPFFRCRRPARALEGHGNRNPGRFGIY